MYKTVHLIYRCAIKPNGTSLKDPCRCVKRESALGQQLVGILAILDTFQFFPPPIQCHCEVRVASVPVVLCKSVNISISSFLSGGGNLLPFLRSIIPTLSPETSDSHLFRF